MSFQHSLPEAQGSTKQEAWISKWPKGMMAQLTAGQFEQSPCVILLFSSVPEHSLFHIVLF
jgi:hypothetical protein